ncbi:hypothetical protein [Dickeya dadantii]|uniref:hypothetical protein n=1 Tax=Dickeya dadantii TaxID=204038 RepID=UPI0021DB4B2E
MASDVLLFLREWFCYCITQAMPEALSTSVKKSLKVIRCEYLQKVNWQVLHQLTSFVVFDPLERFTGWYNEMHRYSGIRYVTPGQRYWGEDRALLKNREEVYQKAKPQHPERWSGRTMNWQPTD